jgi:hypothetical protein
MEVVSPSLVKKLKKCTELENILPVSMRRPTYCDELGLLAQACVLVTQDQMDFFYRYASKNQILTKYNFPSQDLEQLTAFQKLRPKQQKTVTKTVKERLWQKSLKNADRIWTILATFICKMYHIDQTQ